VFGGLDVLGQQRRHRPPAAAARGLPEDSFDRILAVNAKAIYLAAREVVPRFKRRSAGVILNIASTAGVSPRPRLAWYNASKGWVITATRAMAVELAPFGIRGQRAEPGRRRDAAAEDLPRRGHARERAPLPRDDPARALLDAEDIGNAACFLCSDEAVDDHRRRDGGRRRALHLAATAGLRQDRRHGDGGRLDVLRVQPGHAHAPGAHEVHGMLLAQPVDLRRREAGVAEHAALG
jgi:NAD(P)-dependent dehydrogenase (short-subunit alcohol dehydrogenase family)